jgi:hypothetical protein
MYLNVFIKYEICNGGRDYTRTNMCKTARMVIDGGEFVIETDVVE